MKTVDRAKESAEFANWQQLANFWRGRVEQMTSEFIQGHAVVDPNSADSCRYCVVMPLCRIYESQEAVIERENSAESDDGVG